ncbi:unnamed protein product [Mytilus edulis]|uniref:Uncharacterized protein n=1 Tax=Mytilus edulis TaxID=6550 RepID=A0A8S3U1P2_MYTED|nr:unnamed protein product [Mytilus edulis]
MNSDNQVVHDIMQGKGSDLGNITKSIHWPKDDTDNDSTGTIEYDIPDNIKQYSENELENMNTSGKSHEECEVKQKKKSHGTFGLAKEATMSDSGDMYEDEDIPPTPPPPNSRQKLNCVLFERARQIESIEEYDSESGDSEYECESENSAYEYESEDSEYASESEMYRHTQRRVITVPEQTSEEDYSEYDRPTQQQVITALPEQERDEESEAERKKTVPVKKNCQQNH